jgi:hypothetical protein
VSALLDRLQPRSLDGDVYRDEWVERFEPIFYGFALFIALASALAFATQGEWLLGAGFVATVAATVGLARLMFFRAHLVVGDEVLVLVGVFRPRRISFGDVQKAVAADGSLKLKLTDGEEVHVPGHTYWSHARGDVYSNLADIINARLVARAESKGSDGA